MVKPPFKAKPNDKILCPNVGHEIPVEPYCHGWTFRNELCHQADECESYLQYAERRMLELSDKRRKIHLPSKLYDKIEECARVRGLTVSQYAIGVILRNVKEVNAHV